MKRFVPSIRCCLAVVALLGPAAIAAVSAAESGRERIPEAAPGELPPAPLPPTILEALDGLSADAYIAREAAAHELIRHGTAALPALHERLAGRDPEVRRRARAVIAAIEKEAFEDRLDRFVQDEDGKLDHRLPGWERFRGAVGHSAGDRRLFLDMLREEPHLMFVAEGPFPLLRERLAERCQVLQQRTINFNGQPTEEPPLGSLAAILFLASHPQAEISQETGNYLSNLLYRPVLQKPLQGGDQASPVRRLLALWLSRPWDSGPLAYQALMLGLRHDFPGVTATALGVLNQGGGHAQLRMYALLAIARFGMPTHRALVERSLKDETVCFSNRGNGQQNEVQLRDVALCILVDSENGNQSEYGYKRLQRDKNMMYQLPTLAPESAAARTQGIAKWRAAHPENDAAPEAVQ